MNSKIKYCLGGLALGISFPVGATFIALNGMEKSMDNILFIHKSEPLLWIIDLAPFILGSIGCIIGFSIHKIHMLTNYLSNVNSSQDTQLLSLASELESKNIDLNKVTYAAAHDLQTAVRGISSLVQFIDDPDATIEETLTYKRLLKIRINRMSGLLDSLKRYIRLGQTRPQIYQFDPIDIFHQFQKQYPAQKLKLGLQNCKITFDPELFKEIFNELIDNSIKFNPNPVEITITGKITDSGYSILYHDSGIGIDMNFKDKIFNVYSTLEARDVSENIGMGLAIVKRIIQDNNGHIELLNKQNGGATFKLIFPIN